MIDPNDPIQCIWRDIKIFKQLKKNVTGEKIIAFIISNDLAQEEKVTKKTEKEYKDFLTKQDIQDIQALYLYSEKDFTEDLFKKDIETLYLYSEKDFTEDLFKKDNIFPMLNSFYILMRLLVVKFNFYFRIIEIYEKIYDENKNPFINILSIVIQFTHVPPYGLEKDNLYTKIDEVYNNDRKLFDEITNLENTLFKYIDFKSTYKKIYDMCDNYNIEFNFEYCKDWEKSITSLLTFNTPVAKPNLIHKKTKIEIIFPVTNDEFIKFVEIHSNIDNYVSDWKNRNAYIIKANYKKYCTKFIEDMNKFDCNKYVQEQTTLIEKSTNKDDLSDIYDTITIYSPVNIFNININIIKDLTDRMKTIISETDDIYKNLESFSTSITPFKKQITTLHDGFVLLLYNYNRLHDSST